MPEPIKRQSNESWNCLTGYIIIIGTGHMQV